MNPGSTLSRIVFMTLPIDEYLQTVEIPTKAYWKPVISDREGSSDATATAKAGRGWWASSSRERNSNKDGTILSARFLPVDDVDVDATLVVAMIVARRFSKVRAWP